MPLAYWLIRKLPISWNGYSSFSFSILFHSILNIHFNDVSLCLKKVNLDTWFDADFDWKYRWGKAQRRLNLISKWSMWETDIAIWIWLMDFVLNLQLWHKYMCYFHLFEVVRQKRTHKTRTHVLCVCARIVCVFITFRMSFFLSKFFTIYLMIRLFCLFFISYASNDVWNECFIVVLSYSLGDLFVMPFLVEFKIEPSRLKLDCRTILVEFFGGNDGGDGSFNCSMGLCRPQRPIIIFNSFK